MSSEHMQHITQAEDRIPYQQLIAYGFGGIIPIALFNIAGQLMGLIGNISLGLSAFWLGVIMIIPRLWDAISDPMVGHISDNARTRWGRRRPFLLIGGISVAISFVLMWWIPNGDLVHHWFPTEAAFKWFQLVYILFWLLIFFTACTVFEIPHGALGMEMSSDPHERTRLFSAKSFLGNLFAMSTPWLFALASMEIFKGPGGNEADGMRYVSMLVAVILIPLSFWWFFTVREPGFKTASKQTKTPFWQDMKHTASNKTFLNLVAIIFTLAMGFNFVALLGYYIPIFYIFEGDKSAASALLGINGTIWAVTGLIAVFPLNWLGSRFGKRNTLIIAIGLMCLAQLSKIVCYNPQYPYLIIIPTILLSTGMLFFFTLGASMVGDICDEDDLKTGHRSEGSYYSVYWWFIKMGTAFASLVTGLLIMFTQFDETQVTKVDDFQGSINKTIHQVETWNSFIVKEKLLQKALENHNQPSLINTKDQLFNEMLIGYTEAIEESKALLINLNKESLKTQQQSNANALQTDLHLQHKKTQTISTINKLENLLTHLKNIGHESPEFRIKEIIESSLPMILNTSFDKSNLKFSTLLLHIKTQSNASTDTSKHYQNMVRNLSTIHEKIEFSQSNLIRSSSNPESIIKDLQAIKKASVGLTLQTPHTLFWMRAVEIGLPLLLCLFSLFFALRYSLTEERTYEIKGILKTRNAKRLIDSLSSTVLEN